MVQNPFEDEFVGVAGGLDEWDGFVKLELEKLKSKRRRGECWFVGGDQG